MSSEALYIALGWLFGIVSPLLIDANSRLRTVRSLRRGLQFELAEAEQQLAGVIWNVAVKIGTADAELLEWTIMVYERYEGSNDLSVDIATLKALRSDDAPLKKRHEHKWSILREFPTPALDAAVAAIADFPARELEMLLNLRTLFTVYNATVGDTAEFRRLTFDVGPESHSAALTNLTNAYIHIVRIGRKIVDKAAAYRSGTA